MKAHAYVLTRPGAPLVREDRALADPGPGEAIVEVHACGLCHTDLGFAEGSVAPRHPLPLVLGHEITGVVRAVGKGAEALDGATVLVPAVMPCGECAFCRAGRGNACPKQKMPGNDIDGGFATHVRAPGSALVNLARRPESVRLDALSVVADAVSTAWQAVRRSGLERGDVAFVVGGGGVGGFVAQIARALGARVVVCDVHASRLESVRALGVERAVDVSGRDPRDVRKELHGLARDWGVASLGWRVFECSGTAAGQSLAYGLLAQAATMVVVGFTREAVSVRLSNLMAFDATVHGSWGCPVEVYPAVLERIYLGEVVIEPFIERAPMSRLNELLGALARHELTRRMVLDPRA
jgi:6-hydroxycyclohex-1-ene-1-carbonyl-CoA dehydrogenase